MLGNHTRFGLGKQICLVLAIIVIIKIIESYTTNLAISNHFLWPSVYLPSCIGIFISVVLLKISSGKFRLNGRKIKYDPTLYFAKKYLMITLVTFSIMLLVTFLIDLVEHSRRFSGSINFKGLFYLTFLNVPKSFYDIIDLIMLITSISFFISLSKTSELIIVRASGRSIYQTLSAPFL